MHGCVCVCCSITTLVRYLLSYLIILVNDSYVSEHGEIVDAINQSTDATSETLGRNATQ